MFTEKKPDSLNYSNNIVRELRSKEKLVERKRSENALKVSNYP